MNRRKKHPGPRHVFKGSSPVVGHAKGFPHQRLRRRGTKGDDDGWSDDRQFCFEPRPARGDFTGIGLLVEASFPLGLPFEMFNGIGHVNRRTLDACLSQREVEKMAGRTYKRTAFAVLLVSGLFSHHQDVGSTRAFTKDRLHAEFIERTCAATDREFSCFL